MVNDLAASSRYFNRGREGRFAASYQHPPTFASEPLVRAADNRLRLRELESQGESGDRVLARVDELTQGGLTLVEPLFEGLEAFGSYQGNFAALVPILFANIPEPTEP